MNKQSRKQGPGPKTQPLPAEYRHHFILHHSLFWIQHILHAWLPSAAASMGEEKSAPSPASSLTWHSPGKLGVWFELFQTTEVWEPTSEWVPHLVSECSKPGVGCLLLVWAGAYQMLGTKFYLSSTVILMGAGMCLKPAQVPAALSSLPSKALYPIHLQNLDSGLCSYCDFCFLTWPPKVKWTNNLGSSDQNMFPPSQRNAVFNRDCKMLYFSLN